MVAVLPVLIALCVAAPAQERGAAPSAEMVPRFPALAIERQQPRYTGELITLSLKDADIKDVLKTFAVLTDLNIVVDPSVKASVSWKTIQPKMKAPSQEPGDGQLVARRGGSPLTRGRRLSPPPRRPGSCHLHPGLT